MQGPVTVGPLECYDVTEPEGSALERREGDEVLVVDERRHAGAGDSDLDIQTLLQKVEQEMFDRH